MTIRTAEAAAKVAEKTYSNIVGMCQKVTRLYYLAPSAGDVDGDGDADAVDGWKSEPASGRHTDRKPPRGYPVAWSGGKSGHGHRAISLGEVNGKFKIRTTDAPTGKVSTQDLDWPERQWGLKYLGWSETIDGVPIPKPAVAKPASKPTKTPVKVRSRGKLVDTAIHDLMATKKGPPNQVRALRIKEALAALLKIPFV